MNITMGPMDCTQYFFEPAWVFIIGATLGFIVGVGFVIIMTNYRCSE